MPQWLDEPEATIYTLLNIRHERIVLDRYLECTEFDSTL